MMRRRTMRLLTTLVGVGVPLVVGTLIAAPAVPAEGAGTLVVRMDFEVHPDALLAVFAAGSAYAYDYALTSWPDGVFVGDLAAGDYRVLVRDSYRVYEPKWLGSGWCEADAVTATVVPGETTDVSVTGLDYFGPPPKAVPPPTGRPPEDWLGRLNWFRAASGLTPVEPDPCGLLGQPLHIEYLRNTPPELMTGAYQSPHTENPASPWYTPEGAEAGASSNISFVTGFWAIDNWMQAPFHAMSLLHREATHVSFATVAGGPSLLSVRRIHPLLGTPGHTMLFPGDGTRIAMRSHFGEIPSPLDSCNKDFEVIGSYPSLPVFVDRYGVGVGQGVTARITLPDGQVVEGPSRQLCVFPHGSTAIVMYQRSFTDGVHRVEVSDGSSLDVEWEFEVIGSWSDLPAEPSGEPPCHNADCDTIALVDDGGQWTLWHSLDWPEASHSFYYGNPGDYPIMGDWDCDGVATPGQYRRSDGYVYLRNSNTQGVADIRFFFGNPGDIPLAGDFNGDGCDTVSIYRPSESRIFIINELGSNDGGLGTAEFSYLFGNPYDDPYVGDFDGDGIDTVGLYRVSTGYVYFRNSLTTGIADFEFYYGNPGDVILAGDWDGDGDDTVAVYRPSTHFLHINLDNAPGAASYSLPVGEYSAAVTAAR